MVICRLSVPNQQQFHAPSLAAGRPFLALLAQQAVFLRDSYVGLAERPDPHLRRGPDFYGEDGPQILPSIAIDFDVHYGLDYVVFGFSYGGYQLAVSQTGRLCLSPTYSFGPWAGSLSEFKAWIRQFEGDPELELAAQYAELYLAGQAHRK